MINRLKQVRCWVLVQLTHNVALPFLRLIRRPNRLPYNIQQLQQFPNDTLGFELFMFLHLRGLDILPHYTRHDLKHIVLNYDTTEEGEACLQCFMLGNGRVSFPVLTTVIYSILTMPEYWKSMRIAFNKGKHSTPIHNWQWNAILHENTDALRMKIFQHQIRK